MKNVIEKVSKDQDVSNKSKEITAISVIVKRNDKLLKMCEQKVRNLWVSVDQQFLGADLRYLADNP